MKRKVSILILFLCLTLFHPLHGSTISKVVFTTPERNIIAGVRNWLDYGATNYVMTVQLQDDSGNPVPSTETVILMISGTSPQDDFSPDTVNWNVNTITISSGSSQGSFYYYDEITGVHTITVDETPDKGWAAATQDVTVYPNDAYAFRLEHDGTATVYVAEDVTVSALDQFENICTGHPPLDKPYAPSDEWIYYVGIASFTTTGTARVNPLSYDFNEAVNAAVSYTHLTLPTN